MKNVTQFVTSSRGPFLIPEKFESALSIQFQTYNKIQTDHFKTSLTLNQSN